MRKAQGELDEDEEQDKENDCNSDDGRYSICT